MSRIDEIPCVRVFQGDVVWGTVDPRQFLQSFNKLNNQIVS